MPIIPLDESFDGFVTDVSRDQIRKGSVYRLIDFIPQNDAPARGRGGWQFNSASLDGGEWVAGGGWFRKSLDADSEHVLVVTNSGNVYKLQNLDDEDGELVGSLKKVDDPLLHSSLYFDNKLIFVKPEGGLTTWDGKKLKDGMSSYKVVAPWGDFLVVGNKKGNANRVWWAENTTQVLDTLAYADVPSEVVAVAGFPRQIIVFGYQDTWSFYGDNPPPGGDLQMHVLFAKNGCMDQRTMVTSSQFVIWANSSGVYRTDGSQLEDLTAKGGISTFWREMVKDFKLLDGWIATAGLLHNFYFITIHNADAELILTLVCNVDTGKWFEVTNIPAACYIHRPGGINSTEELFFGSRREARACSLSSLWAPSAKNAFDADNKPVLPVLETRYYRLSSEELKRIRRLLMTYQLKSTQGVSFLDVGWVIAPEQSEYESATGQFLLLDPSDRDRVDIRVQARGIAFRIAQTNVSDDTRIFSLELEGHALSEMR